MHSEKVSIVITTRNRSSYLKRAIQSVFDQNYENIEVIVVDDASTDGTQSIAELFGNQIIYVKNQEQMGANASRNIGLANASGSYVSFLDDDDYYCRKDKIKKQVELFKKNKEVGFVGCGYYDALIKKERVPRLRGSINQKLLVSFSDIETSTVMMRKNIVDIVGMLDLSFPSEQNHDFFYRISKIANFDYLYEVFVVKDSPPRQISRSMTNKIKGYLLFHKKHFKDIQALPFKYLIFVCVKFIFTCALFVIIGFIGKPQLLPRLYEKFQEIKNL